MLSTYLAAYPWLPGIALAVLVVVGPLVAWALTGWRLAAGFVTAVAFVGVALLALWPTPDRAVVGCALDWQVDLLAPEPLANVVLLVPATLLLAAATRKPVLAGVMGVVIAAAIELVQAIVPALGRSCDLGDLIANATGAVVGAVLGAVGVALHARRAREVRAEHASRSRMRGDRHR